MVAAIAHGATHTIVIKINPPETSDARTYTKTRTALGSTKAIALCRSDRCNTVPSLFASDAGEIDFDRATGRTGKKEDNDSLPPEGTQGLIQ